MQLYSIHVIPNEDKEGEKSEERNPASVGISNWSFPREDQRAEAPLFDSAYITEIRISLASIDKQCRVN